MNFYDITLTISDTLTTWPTDPVVSIQKTRLISKGNSCNVSPLKFGNKSADTHHTLLRRGIIIVEGLDLSNVKAGNYSITP